MAKYPKLILFIAGVAVILVAILVGTRNGADTGDWPVYRNDKYGFSIKYPPGWQFIEEETDKIGPLSGTAYYVKFDSVDPIAYHRNTLMIFSNNQNNLELLLNQGNSKARYIFVSEKFRGNMTVSKYSYSTIRHDSRNELYIFQHRGLTYAFFTFGIFADLMLDSLAFVD